MSDQQSLFDADETRDERLEEILSHTSDAWRRHALTLIAKHAKTGDVFEAFDLINSGLAEPDHPARWGALFNHAARAGLIASAGAGPSKRPTVNGSLCKKWRGA